MITGLFFVISTVVTLAVTILLVKFLLLGIKYFERELAKNSSSNSNK
jgi:hypothetical protein